MYGHTTRFADFRVIGPSGIRLESDMSDSLDFYISEIRDDRFTDFCVHTARFSGNRPQKVGRIEKIGQWHHGISDRSSSQLSFGAFLKALASKVKEIWPFEDGQNFGFFQFSKNHISKTKLGKGLKFGITIHLIGVYT